MKINMLTLDDDALEEIPLSSYPRPQLKRNSYFCLNGEWDFATSKQDKVTSYNQKIIVPFPMESSLSSINRIKEDNEKLFYKKIFRLPNGFIKDKVILHFGAVDQKCVVKLNNQVLGTHEGGYTPFEFEIKEKLDYINILEVIVEDSLDLDYPYGKQKTKRGGMWYTKISGIWQSVWIESVPEEYIKELKITPTIDTISIKVIGNTQKKEITIYTPEGEYKETFFSDEFSYKFTSPRNWSPEDPYLYHFTIKTTSDEVKSYFALRELSIEEDNGRKYLFLNREKYFFHGLLDQGYFPDGIYTPKKYEYYENDIITMKSLGFNTLRKHIKIEPLLFYYYCDKHGMIVFQDMVNNSPYSFLHDTALPTIGIKNIKDTKLKRSQKAKDLFKQTMKETVSYLYNSPCICLWTIFNEGWGQFDSKDNEILLRKMDNTRFIDNTSGWFDQKDSSLNSVHIYFKKLKIKFDDRPTLLSEFGGYSYKIDSHSYNLSKTYGYKKFTSKDSFENEFYNLYINEVVPLLKKGLCASIYTQVSDVEDETNGLLTYDRKILKVDKEKCLEIAKKLHY